MVIHLFNYFANPLLPFFGSIRKANASKVVAWVYLYAAPMRELVTFSQSLCTELVKSKDIGAGNVIIFDDGVLTGTHLNFLKDFIHYFLDVPQNQIKTLTIVDRTRTPLYAKIAQAKSEHDIRYWRHDVPVFADEHACMFCHAMRLLKELTKQLPSEVQAKITDEWLPIWEAREMYSEWGASGLNPIALEKGNAIRKVTFGIKNNQKNIIDAYDSTTLLAYITEITQIIPNKMSGISKGEKVLDTFPEITVELVAGQFFISFHKLEYADKKESLKLIFRALLQMIAMERTEDELKPYFSLACLCFLIARKKIFHAAWEESIVPFIQEDVQFEWPKSMTALMSALYHHGGKKESFENTKISHENLIAIGVLPKLVTALNDLFAKTAIRFGAHHTTPLTKSVQKLKAIIQSESNAVTFTCIKNSIGDVYDYANKLKVVAPYYPNSASKIKEHSENFYSDYNELCKIISDNDKTGGCADISENFLMYIKNIVEFYEITISEIFEKYIFVLHKERPKSEFLEKLVAECCNELKVEGHEELKNGTPEGSWDTSYYIIAPEDIRNLMKNMIKNTRNHDEKISNPSEPTYFARKYAFLWDVTVEKTGQALFLKISFTNAARQEPKPEFSSREIDCLKVFCGYMDSSYDVSAKLFTISIILPILKA